MMTLVRVLPPEQYDKLIKDIQQGHVEKPQAMPMDHGGMDHGQMQMPMDHKMPGMDHGQMQPTPADHNTMQHGSVRMDHRKTDHSKMRGMDHERMKHPPTIDHGKNHTKQISRPAKRRAAIEAQMEASRRQMEASRKQMEASRKALEVISPADQGGKKQKPAQGNQHGVDHGNMGH
jgi:hypothetical protein